VQLLGAFISYASLGSSCYYEVVVVTVIARSTTPSDARMQQTAPCFLMCFDFDRAADIDPVFSDF
jgi:hypothetical protein